MSLHRHFFSKSLVVVLAHSILLVAGKLFDYRSSQCLYLLHIILSQFYKKKNLQAYYYFLSCWWYLPCDVASSLFAILQFLCVFLFKGNQSVRPFSSCEGRTQTVNCEEGELINIVANSVKYGLLSENYCATPPIQDMNYQECLADQVKSQQIITDL